MNMRTHLTLRPRTPAGQSLLQIGKQLRRVTDGGEAVTWLHHLNDWHTLYGHLTRERSYAKRRLKNGLWDSPTGKRWWYTHDRLRKAYNVLAELQRRKHLFTYLAAGGPKTTSRLEGGINAMIKQALRFHRGMTVEHQKRAAEWVLIERAGLLHAADTMPVTETTTSQKQRPRLTEPDPGQCFTTPNSTLQKGSGYAPDGQAEADTPNAIHTFLPITPKTKKTPTDVGEGLAVRPKGFEPLTF